MNEPAPRELCEKLQAMGCKSEGLFFWFQDGSRKWCCGNAPLGMISFNRDGEKIIDENIPAFFQNDFTGATDRATENSKIVWPGFFIKSAELLYQNSDLPRDDRMEHYMAYYIRRHDMIDIKNEPWWEYLQRTMRK